MIGLFFLIALLIYGALLIAATKAGYSWAKRKGKTGISAACGGLLGFLLVFLPVFWDAIPTWMVFMYYSKKDAGLRVYKSLDQWKRENPGVAETLEPYRFSRRDRRADEISLGDGTSRFPLNARLASDQRTDKLFLSVRALTFRLIDVKTGEVLAQFKAIVSGNSGGIGSGGAGWWKFWIIHGDVIGAHGAAEWSRLINSAANPGEENVKQ